MSEVIYQAIIIAIVFTLIGFMSLHTYSSDLVQAKNTIIGFWAPLPEFLEKSGLSDFQLHIFKEVNGYYHGYVIVARDQKIIFNSPVTIKLNIRKKNTHIIHGQIIFEKDGDFDFDLPDLCDIDWSITGEHLTISKNNELIFDGFKDIYVSIVTKKEWHDFEYQEKFEETVEKYANNLWESIKTLVHI